MIAVDTNVLVHAHRAESPRHLKAAERLKGLAEGRASWAIPWPCVHEFLSKVTHARIFVPPTQPQLALSFLKALAESPALSFLGEGEGHLQRLRELVLIGRIEGARVHDARIAAICLENAVEELWTADRDFGRFPQLRVRNPLID